MPRPRHVAHPATFAIVCVFAIAALIPRHAPAAASPDLPLVVPNDNRVPAGELRDGVLRLHLVALRARWAPEADDGPVVEVDALAEEGRAPSIPAPLIRVPQGTVIEVTIRNDLPDSTLHVTGLMARPATGGEAPLLVPSGESRTARFEAGDAGTYAWFASPGVVDSDLYEREQMAGAIVVDAPGERTDDRIFVINIWGEQVDSTSYHNVLAINGRSWPFTEPLTATVGDTLRWRVVNASVRNHPMHLHGFYFGVDARGDMRRDTLLGPERRRLAVTEDLSRGHTMRMSWVAERPGNWLFHCHIAFHVIDEARLEPRGPHHVHSADPRDHMAGLVLGIAVRPGPDWIEPPHGEPRRMRLLVQEGAPRGLAPRGLGFVLQRDAMQPAADSIELPGSTLVLTRGEHTDIAVVNRLAEATSIHWHGIELESFSDGVAGWSGTGDRLAPSVAPGDSFVAHLTLPRAGTFIYHTHLNDVEQITSGLYGGLIVLEPGQRWDPEHDHLYVAGWDGEAEGRQRIIVQGDSVGAPLEWRTGDSHRLRFVNIGPAQRLLFELRRDTSAAVWRPLAKDGADYPAGTQVDSPARVRLGVGETYDALAQPSEPGDYQVIVRFPGPNGPTVYRQRISVTARP